MSNCLFVVSLFSWWLLSYISAIEKWIFLLHPLKISHPSTKKILSLMAFSNLYRQLQFIHFIVDIIFCVLQKQVIILIQKHCLNMIIFPNKQRACNNPEPTLVITQGWGDSYPNGGDKWTIGQWTIEIEALFSIVGGMKSASSDTENCLQKSCFDSLRPWVEIAIPTWQFFVVAIRNAKGEGKCGKNSLFLPFLFAAKVRCPTFFK